MKNTGNLVLVCANIWLFVNSIIMLLYLFISLIVVLNKQSC